MATFHGNETTNCRSRLTTSWPDAGSSGPADCSPPFAQFKWRAPRDRAVNQVGRATRAYSLGVSESVDLCFPRKDWFTRDPVRRYIAVLSDLTPLFARRRGGPVRHSVLAALSAHKVGEVRDHDDLLIAAGLPALPHDDALSIVEIHVNEIGAVDG